MPASRPRWLTAVLAAVAAVPLLVTPASAAATSTVTVYYKPPSAWSTVNIHYAPTGGAWTTVPGVPMAAASCAGWYTRVVDLGAATGMQAIFNNGSGTWDNNSGRNYTVGAGTVTIDRRRGHRGRPVHGTTPPAGDNTATVFYAKAARTWATVNSTTRRTARRGPRCPAWP